MFNSFYSPLKIYKNSDFEIQQKAKVVCAIIVSVIIIMIFAVSYTVYFNVLTDKFLYMIIPEFISIFIFIFILYLLIKGYFSIASHMVFIISLIVFWLVFFFDRTYLIAQLDTIVYLIGILTMVPLIINREKKVLILYYTINIILLLLYMYFNQTILEISNAVAIEYLLDNIIVIIFVGIISYNIFSINKNALDKANEDIKQRKIAEEKLKHNYQELEASNEELQAAMEELESINEDLVKSQNELMDNENRYRLLAENISDMIWSTDMNLNFTFVSPSITKMFGYSVEEAMAMTPDQLATPESLKKIWKTYSEEIKLEESKNADLDRVVVIELEQVKKDKTLFWAELTVSFIRNSNGEAIGILGVTRDITERKKTQEIIVQTEKMMTVGGLAAGMAHEINNPLGIIVQGVQNITRRISVKLKKNSEVASKYGIDLNNLNLYLEERNINKYLDGIYEAGNRAAEIIKNMLQFSRQSDSKIEDNNINDLIENTIKLASKDYDLKKKYDFKNINIIKDYNSEIKVVPCVKTEIEQVILNLLKNSAHALFTIDNKVAKPEIKIKTYKEEEFAVIVISDNGPGIDKEALTHIFEPFYTTKGPGTGTGLGLSVSYFIITNNHHGMFFAESELENGVKFIIKLPLVK